MKKILVPTDFSENADLALSYAIQVANQLGGTLYVLHTFLIASSTGNLVSIDHLVKADREEEVATLIERMKPQLTAHARMEGMVKHGNPADSIRQAAEKFKADFIIMGTKGAGGMKKLFLGSTASQVIAHSSIPVIVIPDSFIGFRIRSIILALDDKKVADPKLLNPVLDLVKGFYANLNFLRILTEEHPSASFDPDLEDYLSNLGIKYSHFIEEAPEVLEGIRSFVSREKSDLLCLIHHSRGFFQKIFETSVSKELAFDSDIPLLVIPD